MITDKQKELVIRIITAMRTGIDYDEVRANIQAENDYIAQKEKSQTPTPEQRKKEFTI